VGELGENTCGGDPPGAPLSLDVGVVVLQDPQKRRAKQQEETRQDGPDGRPPFTTARCRRGVASESLPAPGHLLSKYVDLREHLTGLRYSIDARQDISALPAAIAATDRGHHSGRLLVTFLEEITSNVLRGDSRWETRRPQGVARSWPLPPTTLPRLRRYDPARARRPPLPRRSRLVGPLTSARRGGAHQPATPGHPPRVRPQSLQTTGSSASTSPE
jgi:hypothetical protein